MAGEIGEKKPILPQPPQNTRRPRLFRFVVGAFIALFVFISGVILWRAYQLWQGQNRAAHLVQVLKDYEDKQYQMALADTYGGKTPQETLQMYIDAVQKGDYELASKYFILDYQSKWKATLQEIQKNNNINIYLNPIKEALNSSGEYSDDRKSFTIYNPVLIDFKLYPSGIWKIVEI